MKFGSAEFTPKIANWNTLHGPIFGDLAFVRQEKTSKPKDTVGQLKYSELMGFGILWVACVGSFGYFFSSRSIYYIYRYIFVHKHIDVFLRYVSMGGGFKSEHVQPIELICWFNIAWRSPRSLISNHHRPHNKKICGNVCKNLANCHNRAIYSCSILIWCPWNTIKRTCSMFLFSYLSSMVVALDTCVFLKVLVGNGLWSMFFVRVLIWQRFVQNCLGIRVKQTFWVDSFLLNYGNLAH